MERSFSQGGENPIKQATTSQIWSVVSRRFANHQCRRGYVHFLEHESKPSNFQVEEEAGSRTETWF